MYLQFFLLSIVTCLLGTKYLIQFLSKKNITDIPNHRSSHQTPVPRGGGIAMLGGILASLLLYVFYYKLDQQLLYFISAVLLAATISFLDDISEVKISLRLLIQTIAVWLMMQATPSYDHTVLLHFMPLWLEKACVGFGLLAFLNIYNFMDGIDGITASQTIHIATTTLLFYLFIPIDEPLVLIVAISLIAISLAFLCFNWQPAQIFMGDVGSISLGLICGWLLINLGLHGYLASTIIIPAYYFADGVFIVLRRLYQGEKIWEPHSEHFFQKAARKNKSHSKVVKKIILANLLLATLSGLAITQPVIAVSGATIFMFWFVRKHMH